VNTISHIQETVRKYVVRQTLTDALTHTFITAGMVLITVSTAFWLLRSPWYGLFGLLPIFFFRPAPFIKRVKTLETRMGLNGELVNSLQLSHIPPDSREGYSQELIQAYIRETAARMETVDVTTFVDHGHLWRSLRFVLISLAVSLIQPAMFPARFWYALTHHIEYTVSPAGNVPYLETTPIELSMTLSGVYLPDRARIIMTTDTGKTSDILNIAAGTCRTQVNLHESFSYHFEFFTQATAEYHISKIEPVSIEELTFHLTYPEYAGLQDEIKRGRRIIAPIHTRVHMRGRASHPLNSATFIYADTLELDCDGTDFSGTFTVQHTASATLSLSSFTDLHESITLYAIPDLPPLVDIFSPGNDIIIPQGMQVPVGIRCGDDYGLVSGRFIAVSTDTQEINLPVKRYALEDTLYLDWDLSGLNLFPGDEVVYFAEIRDNAGNVSTSPLYTVYFPTMEEIYQDISSQENMIETGLQQLQEIHADEQNALSRIEEKILRERTFEWADQESVRELIRNEQEILDQIDEWQDELTRTIDKLNEGIVLDQSSLQRLEEISKILQEIAPDELRHALEEIKTALGKKPQDLQKAIENLKDHQEDLAMALERTLELLRRFQQEEKLRELTERARELAEQANELAETGTDEPSSEQELSELQQEIERLADLLEELAASEGLEHDIQEALKQLAENASKITAQGSSLGQTKTDLDQLAAELSQLYETLVKGRSDRLRQDLLAVFNQLVAISQAEERLIQESDIDTAWQDNVIRATQYAAESLFTLQNKSAYVTPGMGKNLARALAHMRKAKTGIQQNDHEREAMKLINVVCYELLKNMETAAQASSSTGMTSFLQQLFQISQGQMMLNQSLGLLLPVPAVGLSPSQQAQLNRLTARQRALRESLESLRNELPGMQQQDVLNNLIDEMKETEEALYQHKLDRELFERQQKILTRLLDTQRSIRKADYQKERKSKPGAAIVVQEPRPLGEDLGRDRLREIIRQALQDEYPKEYELYIREYFQRLLEEQ
jgi:PAS domain-containing protein